MTSSIDWTQIIITFLGIIGTIGGVFIGYLSSNKIQNESQQHAQKMLRMQITHENKTRFYDRKIDIYFDYVKSVDELISLYGKDIQNKDDEEYLKKALNNMDAYISGSSGIHLIAGGKTFDAYDKLHNLVCRVNEARNKNNEYDELLENLKDARAEFLVIAKVELSLELV